MAKGICIVVEGPCSCDRLIKAKEIPQTPMVTPSNGIIIDKMAAKLYSLGNARPIAISGEGNQRKNRWKT